MAGVIDIDTNKSNTDKLPMVCTYLHVGVAGNVKIRTESGDIETIINAYRVTPVVNGVNQVFDTGTTATGITGFR